LSTLTVILLFVAMAVALALSVAIAYVPMRLLMGTMARNIRQLIERQRERRRVARETPDRRHG